MAHASQISESSFSKIPPELGERVFGEGASSGPWTPPAPRCLKMTCSRARVRYALIVAGHRPVLWPMCRCAARDGGRVDPEAFTNFPCGALGSPPESRV